MLASNGVQKLGGDDFDKSLFKIISEKYKDETGEDLDTEDLSINEVEEEKISLSKRKRTTVEIERELIDVSRAEFEESISSLLAQIEMMCEATLEEANIDPDEIKSVFLAGAALEFLAS